LFNCVSTLVALPLFEADLLPAEKPTWEQLRAQHLAEIRAAFRSLRPKQRVLFFCHDPTALPFLWWDDEVLEKISQIERTIIGHLHSPLYLHLSKLLGGLPVMRRFGHSVRRMSTALNEARSWRDFNVLLCPSLAGIDLLKDGGYYTGELDADAQTPARFHFHALPR
jgi:hypothetical protein